MEKSKKSVLFICADQWRFDCFSFLDHPHALTPNLDKLAKQSVVFKSHFAEQNGIKKQNIIYTS